MAQMMANIQNNVLLMEDFFLFPDDESDAGVLTIKTESWMMTVSLNA